MRPHLLQPAGAAYSISRVVLDAGLSHAPPYAPAGGMRRYRQVAPYLQRLGPFPKRPACLALGVRLGLPVLTADREWRKLALSVQVRAVR
ncbi:MAG: hypothetical protein M3495_00200 [Pseudomonadota bacterium]|nr:hypothetical protein [Pseudomonadota bacterium]